MTTKTKEKTTNYQEAFVLRDDLVQEDIYAFENAIRLFDGRSASYDTIVERAIKIMNRTGFTAQQSIEAEHHLKAAIVAKWISEPECEIAEMSLNGTGRKSTRYFLDGVDVDKMHPGKVRWYGWKIAEAYNQAIEPPDPN